MYLTHFTQADGIRLELAKLEDAESIALLSRELIEYDLGWSWTPKRVERHIQHPDSMVVVARDQEFVVGFALMQLMEHTAHLNLLAVQTSLQRQGVGRDLVKFVEQSAATAGIRSIFLELREINEAAFLFYQTLGYRELKRVPRYYRGKETAIRMVHTKKF